VLSSSLGHRLYVATWGRVFASLYDRFLGKAEAGKLGRLRSDLIAPLRGDIVDVGAGTGINLVYYDHGVEPVMVEPDRFMASQLLARANKLERSVDVRFAPGEALPLADESVDVVVCTLVLCTAPRPDEVVAEAFRVLRPGGSLVFLEHVRSNDEKVAKFQDRFRRPWSVLGCGCQANRTTELLFEPAGFTITSLDRHHLKGCGPMLSDVIAGSARKPVTAP
jgi:ubiquinone/menaquinone biosynthesis C-methylase UbiE